MKKLILTTLSLRGRMAEAIQNLSRRLWIAASLALLAMTALVPSTAHAGEVYDRVMSEQELRCAYVIYPPFFDKNMETGAYEGMSYDLMEEVGRQLDIDIKWTEEVGMDNAFNGLETGRYDSVCAGFWAIPSRAKVGAFTDPFYYDGVYAFARADDVRFDEDKDTINDPDVSIVVLEGELSQYIAEEDFPEAKVLTQPSITGAAVRFMDVASGKADVTFNEMSVYLKYNENNPGKLKVLYPEPLRVGAAGFVLPRDEWQLLQLMNTSIAHMHNIGIVEKILNKYDPESQVFLRIDKPYKVNRP